MLNLFLSILSAAIASGGMMALIITLNAHNDLAIIVALVILGPIMWIPCNYFFLAACTKSSISLSKLYTSFGVGTAVLDAAVGVVVYKQLPHKTILMIAGLIMGVISIIVGSQNKERVPKIPPAMAIGGILLAIVLAWLWLTFQLWILGILAFGVADFFGFFVSVLVVNLLKRWRGKSKIGTDIIGSSIGLTPAVIITILLLCTQTLSFVGPAAAIASIVTATIGSFMLGNVDKKQIIPVLLGCTAIWLLYMAFL